MTIYVRPKEDVPLMRLRRGEDAAIDGATARFLFDQGKVWIVGGDAADFAAHGLVASADAAPPIHYAAAPEAQADVTAAPKEG